MYNPSHVTSFWPLCKESTYFWYVTDITIRPHRWALAISLISVQTLHRKQTNKHLAKQSLSYLNDLKKENLYSVVVRKTMCHPTEEQKYGLSYNKETNQWNFCKMQPLARNKLYALATLLVSKEVTEVEEWNSRQIALMVVYVVSCTLLLLFNILKFFRLQGTTGKERVVDVYSDSNLDMK